MLQQTRECARMHLVPLSSLEQSKQRWLLSFIGSVRYRYSGEQRENLVLLGQWGPLSSLLRNRLQYSTWGKHSWVWLFSCAFLTSRRTSVLSRVPVLH